MIKAKKFLPLFFIMVVYTPGLMSQGNEKPRVLVLTDIEADPDDTQSLIRFLLYSNQWEVEGLIATTSIHQKNFVSPESIIDVLDAYKTVFPNLLFHEKGYPSCEDLQSKVKKGRPVYGMEDVGKGLDSEGSDWIIHILEKDDDRPVWFCIWGGPNTLAQALWKIKNTKTEEEASNIYRKIRIYTISDQDDSGPWIRKTFPGIFYICSPGYTYGYATWLGIAVPFPGSNGDVTNDQWLAENIQQGHGSLGAKYPDVAYSMEGDSPSFLYLINNGLNSPEHPDFGGWGGRYELYTPEIKKDTLFFRKDWPKDEPETRPLWTNAEDSILSPVDGKIYRGIHETLWRWREEYQNDFAARMDWCVKNYEVANHPPVPGLAHPDSLTVKSGGQFYLNAKGTYDPDGDSMSYAWFQYPEAGTYKGIVNFRPYASNLYRLPVTAPMVKSAQTIHFILKVTDKGTPPLTRYKRVIVTVVPE